MILSKRHLALLLVLLSVSIIVALPSLFRLCMIHEIYTDPEARKAALMSAFYVRDRYGSFIGDLTIKDVRVDGSSIIVVVDEKYHGPVEQSRRFWLVYEDREMRTQQVEP